MFPPLVSVVLPVADSQRIRLARNAVNNFLRQHYTPYELLIVNATDTSVLTNRKLDNDQHQAEGYRLKEILVAPSFSISAMRNAGIKAASGDWIFPIDDDDWFHPSRLSFQMARRVEGRPCLLRHQLLIDISTLWDHENYPSNLRAGLALKVQDEGIPATILFPRLKSAATDDVWLYDENVTVNEHAELLGRMAQSSAYPVVCDNSHNSFVRDAGWPLLSIAIFHTKNKLDRDSFFAGFSPGEALPAGLNRSDLNLLKQALRSYNLEIE